MYIKFKTYNCYNATVLINFSFEDMYNSENKSISLFFCKVAIFYWIVWSLAELWFTTETNKDQQT